jgi:hypothetical protein
MKIWHTPGMPLEAILRLVISFLPVIVQPIGRRLLCLLNSLRAQYVYATKKIGRTHVISVYQCWDPDPHGSALNWKSRIRIRSLSFWCGSGSGPHQSVKLDPVRIKVTSRIRIRINMMRIRSTDKIVFNWISCRLIFTSTIQTDFKAFCALSSLYLLMGAISVLTVQKYFFLFWRTL